MEPTTDQPDYIDASDLGFGPGSWPVNFVHGDILWRWSYMRKDREGDVLYVQYHSADDRRHLRVVND